MRLFLPPAADGRDAILRRPLTQETKGCTTAHGDFEQLEKRETIPGRDYRDR